MSKILITGGAGFIGCNAAASFAKDDWQVYVFDNLSRKGSDLNLKWLKENYKNVEFIKGDVREYNSIFKAVKKIGPDIVLHLAAQVAVTTSVSNPREDFEINALGTFNVLEAVRAVNKKILVIYSSTNKVYGDMDSYTIIEKEKHYVYRDFPEGIAESAQLDFHSPYGCSKGSADQYIRDYWRIYSIPSVVLRQSCIYGQRQFGIEDQGWVAWFVIATVFNKKITIYGDGKQVRDILYVDDLISAFKSCISNKEKVTGRIYNIGGGPKLTLSLLNLIDLLQDLTGKKIKLTFSDWRPGDQRIYVSNINLAKKELNWTPKINPKDGVKKLYKWVIENRQQIKQIGL